MRKKSYSISISLIRGVPLRFLILTRWVTDCSISRYRFCFETEYLTNSLPVFLEFEGRIISAVLSFEQSVQGYKLSNNSDRVAAAPCERHGFMAVNMSRDNCQRQQLCSRVPPTTTEALELVWLVPVASDASCRTTRSGGVLLTYYLLVRPACLK